MSRKIVQIAIAGPAHGIHTNLLIALADDGTVWKKREFIGDDSSHPWVKLPSLPEEEPNSFNDFIENPIGG